MNSNRLMTLLAFALFMTGANAQTEEIICYPKFTQVEKGICQNYINGPLNED